MSADRAQRGLLSGYRVIEIGDPAAMFAGKIFGDMGAEVVRVVPSHGDPWRAALPAVPWGGEQVSALWLAYNTSKSMVGLDIDTPEGRDLFEKLVDRADVAVASGPTAWLKERRLLPEQLRATRKKLVAMTITPFGLTGPKHDWIGSDLVLEAAGGMLFLNGDEDRPPVRISEEMVWAQGGSQGAFVALAALQSAQRDGIGESIDLSLQETVAGALVYVMPYWRIERRLRMRHAKTVLGPNISVPSIWPCKDGYVCYRLSFGRGMGKKNLRLIGWMADEGMDDGLLAVDWEKVSLIELTQAEADGYVRRITRFFMTRTRAELYAGARERHMLLFPAMELGDMLGSEQLAQRGFFTELSNPRGGKARFPGASFKTGTLDEPQPFAPPSPIKRYAGAPE